MISEISNSKCIQSSIILTSFGSILSCEHTERQRQRQVGVKVSVNPSIIHCWSMVTLAMTLQNNPPPPIFKRHHRLTLAA